MTAIRHEEMTDPADTDAVVGMMNGLYDEDPASSTEVDRSRFAETVRHFLRHPEAGRIVLVREAGIVIGYAILIPFWSNEYGGTVLFVDELYVVPGRRGRGIARELLQSQVRERPWRTRAMLLEVSPANHRARKLYESIGFTERANSTLSLEFPGVAQGNH
jgi:ribosomal protein S18 acetylase RimI-like enzyme